MCLSAIVAGVGSVVGGLAQASAASKAASAQERIGQQQVDLAREVYGDQTQRFDPFLQSGTNALDAYNYELGLGAKPADYAGFTATPGYAFRRQQGINAIDASAAARGNLLSGSTLKGLTDYGQGSASQEYGNYLNRLGQAASSGQSAAGMQASAGQNYVANASNALGNIGNAQAAGAVGVGNAISGVTDNLVSTLMFSQMMQ